MRFALIDKNNNNRVEAKPEQKGFCPCCGEHVHAKCGEQRIWHWAHDSNKNCDSWWEHETEWHRAWKNNYHVEWQEKPFTDKQTDEKHIADVCTECNLEIELQHSPINPKERASREVFYKDMVWVVDGTRLKKDYPRFIDRFKDFTEEIQPDIYSVILPESIFPKNCLNSSVPVIFDFRNGNVTDNPEDMRRNYLYCLFPIRLGRTAVIARITPEAFIKTTINGEWLPRVNNLVNRLIQDSEQQQQQDKKDWEDYFGKD